MNSFEACINRASLCKKMDDDLLVVCSKCGNSPCLTVLIGDELLEKGRRFQGNNDVSCKQARFRLYRKFTRIKGGITILKVLRF